MTIRAAAGAEVAHMACLFLKHEDTLLEAVRIAERSLSRKSVAHILGVRYPPLSTLFGIARSPCWIHVRCRSTR